jgi:hypothetical protein
LDFRCDTLVNVAPTTGAIHQPHGYTTMPES